MPIEPVVFPEESDEQSRMFKLVVPSSGLSADFLRRAQLLLQDAPEELASSFEAAVRSTDSL